jgi:hypothetical protein
MSFGPVHSLNSEPVEIPKIRRDQHKRIANIVRANAKFPEIALGLVRDYTKGVEHLKSVQHVSEEKCIKVSLFNDYSKMWTVYEFSLEAPLLLETPTL